MTQHPTLYRRTYWGGAPATADESPIYQARNQFAKDYHLHKWVRTPVLITSDRFFDHVECYETGRKQWVVIASPYVRPEGEAEVDAVFQRHQFTRLPYRLYHSEAVSYVRCFRNKRDYLDNFADSVWIHGARLQVI